MSPSCNDSGGDAVAPSNGGGDADLGDSDKDTPGVAVALVYDDSGGGARALIGMGNGVEFTDPENGVGM